MAATPTPSPASPANPASTVLHSVWHGVWSAALSSPWIGVVLAFIALGVVVRVYRFFRWLPVTSAGNDPVRRFSGADRAAIMSRAGGRCEFHGLIGGRCTTTESLHADHVHPHSKGGSTTIGNGQALCSRHNKSKGARIPFEWELRRIEKRRRAYFPTEASIEVVRRAPRP